MILFLLLIISFNINAAFRVGNGGNVLVCDRDIYKETGFSGNYSKLIPQKKNGEKHIILLDLYSGYKRWNRTYNYFEFDVIEELKKQWKDINSYQKVDLKVEDILNIIAKRLKPYSQKRADKLIKLYEKFKKDLYKQNQQELKIDDPFIKSPELNGQDLIDRDDGHHIMKPDGCDVKQLVIQFTEKDFPQEKSFYIDTGLWKKMDAMNKALTIFHELLINENYFYNPKDTTGVRYLVSSIISNYLIYNPSYKAFYYLLKDAKFYKTDFDNSYYPLVICDKENAYLWYTENETSATSYYDACSDHRLNDIKIQFNNEGDLVNINIPTILLDELITNWGHNSRFERNTFFDRKIAITSFENIREVLFSFKNNKLETIKASKLWYSNMSYSINYKNDEDNVNLKSNIITK